VVCIVVYLVVLDLFNSLALVAKKFGKAGAT
jgi:hypothetical protein